MYCFKVANSKFAGAQCRGNVPPILQGRRRPPAELLAQAVALGDGWYEVTQQGALEPRQGPPAPNYSVAEQKLAQAHAYLRQYAIDFIIGNGTPTAQQRQNALDAQIAITTIKEYLGNS